LLNGRGSVWEPQTFAELEEVARQLRRAEVRVLAICGGDGSFFRTLSAMVRAYDGEPLPCFLPLRAGSMNTIARAVGCRRGTPAAVLARVLEDHAAGRPFDVAAHDLIRVNQKHYGFIAGAGVIVNFLRAYYERPERGPAAAAKLLGELAVGGLLGWASVRRLFDSAYGSIECDGRLLGDGELPVVLASSVTEIGLGFKLAYRANSVPGSFQFLAGSISPQQVLIRLPAVRRGKPLSLPGWRDELARHVVVELDRPTHYMIDGDILGEVTRLELSTGPRLAVIR
jgi:diacylglycerol kinase family enzyme